FVARERDRTRLGPGRATVAASCDVQPLEVLDAVHLQRRGLELRSVDAAPQRPAVAFGSERWQGCEILAQDKLDPAPHGFDSEAGLDVDPDRNGNLVVR